MIGLAETSHLFIRNFCALFIASCIFLNGFVPRFVIVEEDYAVLNDILQRQTVLLKFFSMTALPEKIVGDLFSSSANAAKGRRAPASPVKKTKNIPVDFTVISVDTRTGRTTAPVPAPGVEQALAFAPSFSVEQRMLGSPLSGEARVCLVLMMLFFLLPRSSLSDGAAIRFVRRNLSPIRVRELGFSFAFTNFTIGSAQ